MADILPFRGVRYGDSQDLAAVVAPPYDVISPVEQEALYARDPHNVVRLILGREDDKYSRAAALFRQWQAEGVLVTDPDPAVYVYRQTFADPVTGRPLPERLGLVCLLRLEEYGTGKVLPHENTLTGAKADRLDLLRATEAQFESIYGLYSDPDRSVQSFLLEYDDREPVMAQVSDMIGSSHRVERIPDPDAVMALRELLADKPVFIADGHHRYETALNYRREVRAQLATHGSEPEEGSLAADYILITLTAFEDPGLLVLPTHRLVRGVEEARIAALPQSLAPQFEIVETAPDALEAALAAQAGQGRKSFGLVLPQGRCFLATLAAGPAGTAPLANLDVTLLHSRVLEQRLGIDAAALAAGANVGYTRDATEALAQVADGRAQAAFLLARPSVEDVRAVSLAGEKMPQKSTFFFPKLLSGLLLRDLTRDDPAEALRSLEE